MRQLLVASAMLACATTAGAQPARLPVEQMTCEQLLTEMTASGDQLDQADAIFAANGVDADAQANAAMGGQSAAGAIAEGVASGLACAVPGVAMACMVMQGKQALTGAAQMQQGVEQNRRMMQQYEQATAGLDLNRMTAITKRVEALKCTG